MIKMRLDILSSLSIYIIFDFLIFALLIDNLLFGKKMVDTLVKLIISFIASNDENIGNHGYIDTSILQIYRIYRIYRRYIGGYFGKKYR